ncbi:MAG: HD domain-containing protein [Bacilli bacterium]|nr:HD domain-containing protein [Bacilli bacterium]
MKNNYEYYRLAGNILSNNYFLELKKDNHHGTNKYDHCKRVSYVSFLFAKIFKADCKEVVRAGLLHDFFFGERTEKEENSYLNHPHTSAINAKKYFNITDKEASDIRTHMFHHVLVKKIFPFVNYKEKAKIKDNRPRSKEATIICLSDLLVSVYEFEKYRLRYGISLTFLFLINLLTIQ